MNYFKAAAKLIDEGVGTLIHLAEYGFVLTVEGARRMACRFGQETYHERLRILKVEDGERSSGRNRFVVFVIYCSGPLPSFTTAAVEAFAAAGYDVVAVLNLPPDARALAYLNRWSRFIVHRANVGRDFGGYKDGISVLSARIGVPDRLIIANDSIFYLEDGLADMIASLEGPEDFVGASEVFDHHYHVGSYLLSFSRRVMETEAFKTFWANYKPITTRRWAILKGEGLLTVALIKAGFPPKVLFKAEDLRKHLTVASPQAFSGLVSLLPMPTRKSFAPLFESVLEQLKSNDKEAGSSAVDTATPIIEAVISSNQLHTGGFLFQKFMKLPIIKRDIVFRELYELHEVRQALFEVPDQTLADVMEDLLTRGAGAQLDTWNRLLYRHSAI